MLILANYLIKRNYGYMSMGSFKKIYSLLKTLKDHASNKCCKEHEVFLFRGFQCYKKCIALFLISLTAKNADSVGNVLVSGALRLTTFQLLPRCLIKIPPPPPLQCTFKLLSMLLHMYNRLLQFVITICSGLYQR